MSKKYDEYLENHRNAVIKAYQWISTYIPEFSGTKEAHDIVLHDVTKYAPDEYIPYDNYFYGEKSLTATIAFNRAWLMHIHRNPHHWQYWILVRDDEPEEILEMPLEYVIEMIADWWSFSFRSGNLREIFSWYETHEPGMILHPKTKNLVEGILGRIKEELDKEETEHEQA